MSNDKKCSNCDYAVIDPVWCEYKCKKHHRVCNEQEVVAGCSDWGQSDTKYDVKPVEYIIPICESNQ